MNYWKYKVFSSTNKPPGESLEEHLNTLGSEGWEMVNGQYTGTDFTFFFKKPDFAKELEARMQQMMLRYQAKQEATELMRDLEKPHTDQ